MQSNGGNNVSRGELRTVIISGFMLFAVVFCDSLFGFVQITSGLFSITNIILSVYCFYSGSRFNKLFYAMPSMSQQGKDAIQVSQRMSALLLVASIGFAVYAIAPRYPGGYLKTAALNIAKLCSTLTLWCMVQYLRIQQSRGKRRSVAPIPRPSITKLGSKQSQSKSAVPVESSNIKTCTPDVAKE